MKFSARKLVNLPEACYVGKAAQFRRFDPLEHGVFAMLFPTFRRLNAKYYLPRGDAGYKGNDGVP